MHRELFELDGLEVKVVDQSITAFGTAFGGPHRRCCYQIASARMRMLFPTRKLAGLPVPQGL